MSHDKPDLLKTFSLLKRRQALKIFGAGAVFTASEHITGGFGAESLEAQSLEDHSTALQTFPLTDVRLLDGPFLKAQKRDEAYLLRLEADRMLHNFRVNAGLEPKAAVYGGWESVEEWVGIRAHGHTLGHFLTASSLMYASTGHEELRKRVSYIVGELAECQNAAGTGLINAFPDNTEQIDNMIAGRRSIGVVWYTLHKIYAGLRDAYLLCGNEQARDVMVRFADWAVDITKDMSEEEFQRMLRIEHGGINEVFANIYTITNDNKYLELAEKFCHHAVLEPLSERQDTLNGLHSNTQIPKFVGFERIYHLTGKQIYHDAADYFWETVTTTRTFATGGNGDREHFFPIDEFAKRLSSAKTMESCCSHNMLRLTRLLFINEPSATYGDYYERALFNAILGSQDPDTGMVTYFQSTRPGYLKLYCTPFDSFWCCTGSGIENHAKYGDSIYFQGNPDGTSADSLYVNLFIASTLNWKDKGVTIKQITSFPESDSTRLEITASTPQEFTLFIRHPGWASTASVSINGSAAQIYRNPGSFIEVKRTWKNGDSIEVTMPMTMRMELLPGTADTAAFVYGPIVLVGALGHTLKPGEDLHINERTIGTVFNEPIEVPEFVGTLEEIPSKIKPVGEPLTFRTDGIGKPVDVTLIPYYKLAHQHYNIYWKIRSI